MKIQKKSIIYVLLIVWILRVYYSPFFTKYYAIISYIYAFLIGIYLFLNFLKSKRIQADLMRGIKAFIIPFYVVSILSIICAAFFYHTPNHSDITQSIVRMFEYTVAFLIAYITYKVFREKSLNIFLVTCWVSYIPVILKWIFAAGIPGVFHIFDSFGGISLEVHNITYCFGISLIYYTLTKKYKNSILVFFLLVGIIIGNKRALYIGLLLSLLFYNLLYKFEKKSKLILLLTSTLFVAAAFASLVLIKSGYFEMIIRYIGIKDSSRISLWTYFAPYYEISPKYLGRGISFTDNLAAKKSVMIELGVYDGAIPIHNDILRSYIGWGFLPFLYYYYNFFVRRTKELSNLRSTKTGWNYATIVVCIFAIYYFDNCLTEITFNICFFIIYFLLDNMDSIEGK